VFVAAGWVFPTELPPQWQARTWFEHQALVGETAAANLALAKFIMASSSIKVELSIRHLTDCEPMRFVVKV
jgi:hypothetical protein